MARPRRIKSENEAYYHLMSRISGRQFLLAPAKVKDAVQLALDRAAYFSGVTIYAHCIMDDHFHVVCRVGKSETPPSEDEVIKRVAVLKGQRYADDLAKYLYELHKAGMFNSIEEELNRWRRRMNDVSEFMKTFKELVNIVYKRDHEYSGSLWGGRFKSTMIEDGEYLATCIRYVELNPVRAKMVSRMTEYRWSSAFAGVKDKMISYAGPGPERKMVIDDERLMKRVAQIGAGRIFGSEGFVKKWINAMGHCMKSRSVIAMQVVGKAYSSHGYLLAKKWEAGKRAA